jgi:hypothetical protein
MVQINVCADGVVIISSSLQTLEEALQQLDNAAQGMG